MSINCVLDFRVNSPENTPTRAYEDDAGLDLRARKEYDLYPEERMLVDTGVQVRIPKGYVGLLFPRSSLSKKGIEMTNSVGVIDSSYRGNIFASLMFVRNCSEHLSLSKQKIEKNERIVQLVILPILLPILNNCTNELNESWNDTTRSHGGFGSTGTK